MSKDIFEGFTCVDMHGIWINQSDPNQALKEVSYLVGHDSRQYVCFFEANLFNRTLGDKKIRDIINHAALVYPDGIAIKVCAQLRSGMKLTRVSGPTFMLKACEYGISKKWRHFFLGGAPGIAERLAENLKIRYPDIKIAGCFCPPFREWTPEEETEIKTRIEESHTDLLWVGLGGPKQEIWMNKNCEKIDVPIMLGVGAAFDFLTGNRPWAPMFIRVIGMEWLWRLLFGGRRIMWRNIKCVSKVSMVLLWDIIRAPFVGCRRSKAVCYLPGEGDRCRWETETNAIRH